jgi:hypothetical protein
MKARLPGLESPIHALSESNYRQANCEEKNLLKGQCPLRARLGRWVVYGLARERLRRIDRQLSSRSAAQAEAQNGGSAFALWIMARISWGWAPRHFPRAIGAA